MDTVRNVWIWLNSIVWMEWAKLVFDLIKGIAWPLAIFLMVRMFKTQIAEKLKDLIEAGPTGAKFKEPIQPDQPPVTTGPASQPLHEPVFQVVYDQERRIEDDLEKIPQQEHIVRLVRALAETQAVARFEFVFGAIFGSQLSVLRFLIGNGHTPMPDVVKWFDDHVPPLWHPSVEMTFEKWSAFLFGQGLINLNDNVASVSEFGQDFMKFVDLQRADVIKPN
ncbi:hypothetical protein [Rhizobium sp. BE258]|uniref:hypothetical protein n=1 Tax=Rhizobium sp. BE258 TaxID=2817722 RepID=UPI0028553E8E|nr:hypothetical protein [Rhizobium sp. BE258]MDR7147045.1 hypothetical protein [Rhizobium sp. BE258]